MTDEQAVRADAFRAILERDKECVAILKAGRVEAEGALRGSRELGPGYARLAHDIDTGAETSPEAKELVDYWRSVYLPALEASSRLDFVGTLNMADYSSPPSPPEMSNCDPNNPNGIDAFSPLSPTSNCNADNPNAITGFSPRPTH